MSNDINLSEVLSSNYLLADLTVRTWGGTKTDADASTQLTQSAGASEDSARVVKKLLAGNDKPLKDTQGAFNKIRTWFYDNTLPWTASVEGSRRGKRIVGALDAIKFLGTFATMKKEAEAELAVFLRQYDQLVQSAIGQLGSLGNPDDYPSAASIGKAFSASLRLDPVPAQSDFSRVTLPAPITMGLQRLYEQQAQKQVQNALADFHGRLSSELVRLHTQLSKTAAGEKTRLFKSLLTNLQQLVALARSLVPVDPTLGEVADRIERELLQHDVESFKENMALSRAVAERAGALHAELTGTAEISATVVQADPTPSPEQETSEEAGEEVDLSAASKDELLKAADDFDVDALIM